MIKKPILLMILDGFGISEKKEGNAIKSAKTPTLDTLFSTYPNSLLQASGEYVGLPEGQMGNSEVGHLNIGAGRVVYQDLTRITKSIKDGDFFRNKQFLEAFENVKKHNSSLHLIGLLSDGGVHSHITHLYTLLEFAKNEGIKKVYVHAFLDGRDVPPKSAFTYIEDTEKKMKQYCGKFATISGRYYAMDRDKRWDRVKKVYDAITEGKGIKAQNSFDAVKNAYFRGETDEFVTPTVINEAYISDNDSVIFFNFRSDRAREITLSLIEPNFKEFERNLFPKTHFVCLTSYDETFNTHVAFQPQTMKNIFADVISENGLKQLRIAETEKYAHVTFFFNGGIEIPIDGEERILIPSPKISTYDLKPEMSAFLVTEKVVSALESKKYDIIILNYANLDMVGHTGVFDATVKAVEAIDICINKVYETVKKVGGLLIITADHGNAEKMLDDNGGIHTAHTSNPVPFIFCENGVKVKNGKLSDIAPTILYILGIKKPDEMTGNPLVTT